MKNFLKRLFGVGTGIPYADDPGTDSTTSAKTISVRSGRGGAATDMSVVNVLRRLFGMGKRPEGPRLLSHRTYSARDRERTVDVVSVKRKLGAAFFSRQIGPGLRRSKLRSLSPRELEIAIEQGWLPPAKPKPARGGKLQQFEPKYDPNL